MWRDHFRADKYTYTCCAAVNAPVEVITRASRAWAEDLGWFPDEGREPQLVFRIVRFYRAWRRITVEVSADPEEDGLVELRFTASMDRDMVPGWPADIRRVAESFAHGVCGQLRRTGVVVKPNELGEAPPHRGRLVRVEKWRHLVQSALAALLVPVCVAAGFATRSWGLAVVVALWILAGLAWAMLLRARIVGMKAWGQDASVWFVFLVAVACTALAAAGLIIR